MSKDKFEWTDELAKEFTMFRSRFYSPDEDQLLEAFKKYKRGETFLWAERKEQPKEPERILVETISEGASGRDGAVHTLMTSHRIPKEKLPSVKAAIEQVLNDDRKEDGMAWRDSLGRLHLYDWKYTEKDLEDAFNAARLVITNAPQIKVWDAKYPYFQNYLNQLKSK